MSNDNSLLETQICVTNHLPHKSVVPSNKKPVFDHTMVEVRNCAKGHLIARAKVNGLPQVYSGGEVHLAQMLEQLDIDIEHLTQVRSSLLAAKQRLERAQDTSTNTQAEDHVASPKLTGGGALF